MKEVIHKMESYADACTEVYTILSYLNENEYKKIPNNIIKVIEDNRNLEYVYKYDEKLELKQQELLKETKAILFNLFRDYLCTEKQREIIKKQQTEEREKNELKKIAKYGSKEIFNNKESKTNIENMQQENTESKNISIVKYKESLFIKIINRIKMFFIKK